MRDDFRTPPEELEHLLGQISEVKATLREIAARLSQIERYAKRAFRLPKSPATGTSRSRPPRAPSPPPTLSQLEALKIFEELPRLLESQGREAIDRRLSTLELPDLKLMVQELGVPLPSKPSRKTLTAAILGRVNESLLLSRNRNVSSPRSKPSGPSDTSDGSVSQ